MSIVIFDISVLDIENGGGCKVVYSYLRIVYKI